MGDRAAGDRERWDARHAAGRSQGPGTLVPELRVALDRLGAGEGRRAVDLACGSGRHAFELARRGYRVEAWDVSPVALGRVSEQAAALGLELETREVDLAGDLPALPGFELALVVNFLDRGLYADLSRLVRPAGHALVSTFTEDRAGEHPRRAWCLDRGELARGLEGFESVHVAEAAGRATLLARRLAIGGEESQG